MVEEGQALTFALGGQVRVLKILSLPDRRGPAPEARACYEEISAPPALSSNFDAL